MDLAEAVAQWGLPRVLFTLSLYAFILEKEEQRVIIILFFVLLLMESVKISIYFVPQTKSNFFLILLQTLETKQ
jgi:hypothetical protein